MIPKKALVLCCSPKPNGGVSQSLANHFSEGLREKGVVVGQRNVLASMKEDRPGLIDDCRSSDLIVLSFPLYVDSLPAHVIEWMEIMAMEAMNEERSFLAIGQCANPEPGQIDIAIDILHNFTRRMKWTWVGGLRMGMGPALGDNALKEAGRPARYAIQGLDLAIGSIAKGEKVSKDAVDTFSKRAVPTFIYLMMANRLKKKESKRYGAYGKLMDRPFGR